MLFATILAAALAASFDQGTSSAPSSATPPNPAQLFTQVCFQGGAALPPGQIASARYPEMPANARRALGALAFSTEQSLPNFTEPLPLPGDKVPNPVYRLAGGQAFLLSPSREPVPGETLAAQCLVVWHGRHWAEIQSALGPWYSLEQPVIDAAERARHGGGVISFQLEDAEITIAVHRDWTILRSKPVNKTE